MDPIAASWMRLANVNRDKVVDIQLSHNVAFAITWSTMNGCWDWNIRSLMPVVKWDPIELRRSHPNYRSTECCPCNHPSLEAQNWKGYKWRKNLTPQSINILMPNERLSNIKYGLICVNLNLNIVERFLCTRMLHRNRGISAGLGSDYCLLEDVYCVDGSTGDASLCHLPVAGSSS